MIYYVIHGNRIKIGTSGTWRKRLESIPHDRLLALEPGGIRVERERLRQFRDHRIGTTEWFTEAPELWEHIERLSTDRRVTALIDTYNSELVRRKKFGGGGR